MSTLKAVPTSTTDAAPMATRDSITNFAARLGINNPNNQASAARYDNVPLSRNRGQLEAMYRSSWIAGQVVDTVAEDMTREGVTLSGDIEPEEIEKLEKRASRLQLWNALCDGFKWGRLYGGAIGVLLIDGQRPDTPLKPETIRKGQFKGLQIFDRWSAIPDLFRPVTELGPELGTPQFYDIVASGLNANVTFRVHHTRCIRFGGITLPYWQRIAEMMWDESVIERLYDRLVAFDSTTQGAAQLIYKAHLRTYSVKGLRDIVATGGKAMDGLVAQLNMIRQYQSNEGMTLLDTEDEFEAHAYTFSGLSDMMLQFGQQLSGATGIPLVRLFGQSPAGLNATGDADIRNYYDNIKQQQERNRPGITKVYDCLYRSELGKEPDETFDFEFQPLWQLDDKEKADVAKSITESVLAAFSADAIDRDTVLKELKQSSAITGIFTNITDEQISEAETEEPPRLAEPELPMGMTPGEPGAPVAGADPKAAAEAPNANGTTKAAGDADK